MKATDAGPFIYHPPSKSYRFRTVFVERAARKEVEELKKRWWWTRPKNWRSSDLIKPLRTEIQIVELRVFWYWEGGDYEIMGEVVLAEYFFWQGWCFQGGLEISRFREGSGGLMTITVTFVTSFWFFRIKISYNHCLSLGILNHHFSPTLLRGGERVSNLGVTRVYT